MLPVFLDLFHGRLVTHLVAVACNWKSGTTKYMWLIHWSIEFHRFQLGQYERTKHDSTSIAWGLVNKLGINCRGRGEQGSKGGGLGLGLVEITNFTKLSGKFQPETRKCFSFITILHCSQISDASNIWYWFNWRFSLHDRILEELTLGRWLKWLTVRSKESQQSGSRCRGSLPGGRSSILTISRNK